MPVGLRGPVLDHAGRVRGEEDGLVDERLGALGEYLEVRGREGRGQRVEGLVGRWRRC